jgi:hypothetical protein
MSIQRDLDELNNITLEIQRLTGLIRDFRKQKRLVEERVISFLKGQETHGVRYNDQAVLLEQKSVRNKKKKGEKLNDLSTVLRKHGIQGSEDLVREILETQRGTPMDSDRLKMVRRT